jgi:hypothetical protein
MKMKTQQFDKKRKPQPDIISRRRRTEDPRKLSAAS